MTYTYDIHRYTHMTYRHTQMTYTYDIHRYTTTSTTTTHTMHYHDQLEVHIHIPTLTHRRTYTCSTHASPLTLLCLCKSAPFSNSSFATSTWPLQAANMRAVLQSCMAGRGTQGRGSERRRCGLTATATDAAGGGSTNQPVLTLTHTACGTGTDTSTVTHTSTHTQILKHT